MPSLLERLEVTGKPIFVLIGIILSVAYWTMNGNPTERLDAENASLQTEISKVQQKIKEAENRLANKAKFEEEMEHLSQTFKLAVEYLPKDLNIQDILKKTYLESRSSGVELSSFVPKESSPKDFYDEVPVDIKLRGPYGQLVTFLANISRLPRIINVRDVEISTPKFTDGVPIMEFKGSLVVYRYKEATK
jgi:type IV pilus assembly protein PilO